MSELLKKHQKKKLDMRVKILSCTNQLIIKEKN